MEMSDCPQSDNKTKIVMTSTHSCQNAQYEESKMSIGGINKSSVSQCDSMGPGGDANIGHRKSKKKRKSKHQEVYGEIETSCKRKKTKETREVRDEWPGLTLISRPEGLSHKRKSMVEMDIEKNRPKIEKCLGDKHKVSPNRSCEKTFSFTDELEKLKKDMEQSKKKKEKKQKLETTVTLESVNKSEPEKVDNVKNSVQSEEESNLDKTVNKDDWSELRKLCRLRKQQLKAVPMVRLKGVGKEADLQILDQRTPILPCDVQQFIMLSQLGRRDCPRFPRWVELKKFDRLSKTVVLVVEGASAYDFFSMESSCPTLQQMDIKVDMVSPYRYNSSIVEELCAVPLTRQQKKDLEKKFGKEICPEALLTDRVIKVLRSAFSISCVPKNISEEVEQKICVPASDRFPRTELLLSAWQLIEEGYPLPFNNEELKNRYPDYVMTKDQYTEVTPSSPMWALDCEMCLTSVGNELTRISVVDEQHKTVYESFCLPHNPIKNYLTEYSGITAEMLKGVTTRLEDIQRDLRQLFPADVILVGQSLGADLHALKMMHPYVIDTSVIFNLTGNRRHKSKLSRLAMEFLNEAIQQRGADGHDSVEDSLAALKLVQYKLTKSIEFGDAVLSGLKDDTNDNSSNLNTTYPEHHAGEFEDLKIEVGPTMATSLFKHIAMRKKKVTVIGQEEVLAEYSTFIAAAHRENKQLVSSVTTDNNIATIHSVCSECKNSNFTLAHVMLGDEEDVTTVDSWMKRIIDSPPFNSLFIVVLVGSHVNDANGGCLAKVKKPNLKLKTLKAD